MINKIQYLKKQPSVGMAADLGTGGDNYLFDPSANPGYTPTYIAISPDGTYYDPTTNIVIDPNIVTVDPTIVVVDPNTGTTVIDPTINNTGTTVIDPRVLTGGSTSSLPPPPIDVQPLPPPPPPQPLPQPPIAPPLPTQPTRVEINNEALRILRIPQSKLDTKNLMQSYGQLIVGGFSNKTLRELQTEYTAVTGNNPVIYDTDPAGNIIIITKI